jgi:hypothetical protein
MAIPLKFMASEFVCFGIENQFRQLEPTLSVLSLMAVKRELAGNGFTACIVHNLLGVLHSCGDMRKPATYGIYRNISPIDLLYSSAGTDLAAINRIFTPRNGTALAGAEPLIGRRRND